MDAGLEEQQKGTGRLAGSTVLSAQQLYQHDPLLVLLKDRLRLNDRWIIVGVIVLPAAFSLSWWFGLAQKLSFWNPGNTLSALLLTVVIFPFLFMVYLLVPTSIANLFNTLRANGVIGEHRKHQPGSQTYENFIQQLVFWLDARWWTIATLVILVLYVFYRLLLIEPRISSPVPYWFRVSALIMYLPLMYGACMSVIRLLLTLIFTNWLFTLFTIEIQPLHTDGSGGLGALGSILWVSVMIMVWDALLFGAAVLSNNVHWFSPLEMVLLAAIYVALTPSLLLGWLVLPHRVMVSARDEALQPLSNAFQQALAESMPSAEHDTRAVVAGTRRLTALKERYDLVRDTFPTWPLEVSGLSRLVVTVILPALLPLILPLIASLISLVSHVIGLP